MQQPIIDTYDVSEEFLYNKTYMFIKGYATGCQLNQTLKALPLARKIHNGQHRKGTVEVNGELYHLPYILHVLKVASTLISLHLKLEPEELDILIAAALLHDSIEEGDNFFKKEGRELITEYDFPKQIYEIIKMLSKQPGASQEELSRYFNQIKKNKFALLIKIADRSHNVEDLYNMKVDKLHKYVKETRDFIYPLASYGKEHYPELSNGITIIKSKIVSLTELTETIINMYEDKISAIINEKDNEIQRLTEENASLKKKIKKP